MNEFKASELGGDIKDDASIKSEGMMFGFSNYLFENNTIPMFAQLHNEHALSLSHVLFVRADSSSRRSARDPELPKSSRRHASTGSSADPERSEKSRSRRSKQSNKDLSESTRSKCASEGGGTDIPKKSRRKKSKDSADGSSRSSRTSRRGQSSKSDTASECGSVSKSNNINNECSQTSGVNHSEGGEVKEHTGIS